MRPITLLLAVFLTSVLPSTAQDFAQTKPVRRNHFGVVLSVSRWDDAKSLKLAPYDYTSRQSGPFASDGFGITFSYHRRLGHSRSPAVLVGGDVGGQSHDNERAAIWTNAITGEQSSVRLSLIWGHVTGSARFVWRESRMPEVVLGAGAGLYLLRMQEEIEGFGYADTGPDDTSWGGFLSAGLRFPIGGGRLKIATDLKWHTFSFSNLGAEFPGQQAAGPGYTVDLGVSWNF